MSVTTQNESKICIKVMVDKVKNRVVYAQADHSFVNILFSFMTFPLGAIVRQLKKQQTDNSFEVLSSLNNLYQSISDLPESYFSNEIFKSILLNPIIPSHEIFKVKTADTEPKNYFTCQHWNLGHREFSRGNKKKCFFCEKPMNRELPCKDFSSNANDNDDCIGGGMFVSDISSFIVTDDLLVMPYTPGCCIQFLTELGITDTTNLEEKTVDFCYEKILDLLSLSMSDIYPLTYLVLSKKIMHIKRDEYSNLDPKAESISKTFLQVYFQKSSGKLLFAEAEDDFVDIVSSFLSISPGTLIGTLMDGSSSLVFLENIFKSIKSRDLDKYFESYTTKEMLTKPHFGQRYELKKDNWTYISPLGNRTDKLLDTLVLKYRKNKGEMFNRSGVFKRSGMFMVTDDLVITPSLSASTMDILNKFQVPLNDIERHKVSINFEEVLRIMIASLSSKSALTKGLEHQLKKLNQNL